MGNERTGLTLSCGVSGIHDTGGESGEGTWKGNAAILEKYAYCYNKKGKIQ